MYNSKEVHLQVGYRVLQYLKRSPKKEIMFEMNDKLLIKAYTDVGYV